MVLDTKLHIDANVRRATLAEDRATKHEIDFTIRHTNLVIADPFADIKVLIKQNNKEDKQVLLERIKYLQDQRDKFVETTIEEEKTK